MKCFSWQIEHSRSFGSIKRPVAEIRLKSANGEWQPLFLYVDSGADVTVVRRSLADLLGIKLKEGRFSVFGGIGEGKIETYIHKLDLKIGYYTLKRVEVAFCVDDSTPNLLGRKGIFDVADIYFKCVDESTCFLLKKG